MENAIAPKIKNNLKIYNQIKLIIKQEKEPIEKLRLVQAAAQFASRNFTGYFSDPELENYALQYAIIPFSQQSTYEKKSILHVFTECYSTGGHTRLAYWAIKSLHNYRHTVVVINQRTCFPKWFKEILPPEQLILQDAKQDFFKKAMQLQQLSLNKEIIILYTHVDDIVPLLAYGTTSFTRPILYYNHADHLFWLGVSISDCILELSSDGQELSRFSRGVTNSELCYIPIEVPKLQTPKKIARTKLGIPIDKYVILSTGSAYKFKTNEYSLIDFAIKYHDTDNFMFIFIGPSSISDSEWHQAEKDGNGNIKVIGLVNDLQEFNLYLDSADLYINSYPVGSLTALLQATIRQNLPVLNIKLTAGYDVFSNSYAFVDNISKLFDKIIDVKQNKYEQEIQAIREKILLRHGLPYWSSHLEETISRYSKMHHHVDSKFQAKYGVDFAHATYAQILLCSRQTTNMKVSIYNLKLHFNNQIKLFALLFNLRIFIFDIPRLFKAFIRRLNEYFYVNYKIRQ